MSNARITPIEQTLKEDMSNLIEEGLFEDFCYYVSTHRQVITQLAQCDEAFANFIVKGYETGVLHEDGTCANDLGALYYMGDIVPQDYEKAAKLYEQAIGWGCFQSIINMGYIYEYGRIGDPDYRKAYEYYALACALAPQFEALYKMGDMYSRGKAVPRNLSVALSLWERSLEEAKGVVEAAQPAIRIAPLLLDPKDSGAQVDIMRALSLFQTAEVGLRIDIEAGQYYYKKRLQQAIDGQEQARRLLDEACLSI